MNNFVGIPPYFFFNFSLISIVFNKCSCICLELDNLHIRPLSKRVVSLLIFFLPSLVTLGQFPTVI